MKILFLIMMLCLTITYAKPYRFTAPISVKFENDFDVDTPEVGFTTMYTAPDGKFRNKFSDGSTSEMGGIDANTEYVSVSKYRVNSCRNI